MSARAQQFALAGEFLLEEAVLDVLWEARRNGECLGPAEISKRAGIFRESGLAKKSGNDDIVWGILAKLVKHGRVHKCRKDPLKSKKEDGWELADDEFEKRHDDMRDALSFG